MHTESPAMSLGEKSQKNQIKSNLDLSTIDEYFEYKCTEHLQNQVERVKEKIYLPKSLIN